MPRPSRPPSAARVAVLVAVVLALVSGAVPTPGATAATPGVSTTQERVAAAAAAPGTDARGRAKADELRQVARDALRERRAGDDDVDLDGSLLGVGGVVWRIVLVVLIALAVVIAVSLYRRGPRRRRRTGAVHAAPADGADELERLARRAEEQGRHRAAVALWFRAGARRLGHRTGDADDPTATATQVARATGDPRVGTLAVAHDRAVYGPGPVEADQSRAAREGWIAVLRDPVPDRGGRT